MDRHGHRSLIATLLLAGVLASLSSGDEARANRPDAAIGAYHITVFLPESDGSDDPNLEDWQASMVTEVTDEVLEACLFWAEQAPESAGFSCHLTYYDPSDTPTSYEPITREGGQPLLGFWGGDEDKWINEIMDTLGFSSIWLYYHDEVEDYNDWAQDESDTDEAFSAFVVNSLEDEDGSFSDGSSAYVPQLRAPLPGDDLGQRRLAKGCWARIRCSRWALTRWATSSGPRTSTAAATATATDVSNGFSNENHEDCPGGAQTSCLMRGDYPCGQYVYPYPICFWSRGQVGWEPECPPVGRCGFLGPAECASGDQCVDESLFCDGAADCGDASDELGCRPGGEDEYRCAEGDCRPTWELCSAPTPTVTAIGTEAAAARTAMTAVKGCSLEPRRPATSSTMTATAISTRASTVIEMVSAPVKIRRTVTTSTRPFIPALMRSAATGRPELLGSRRRVRLRRPGRRRARRSRLRRRRLRRYRPRHWRLLPRL